jgi:hypothetical protein
LMPGEMRRIHMEVENSDAGGDKPVVAVEGLNVD